MRIAFYAPLKPPDHPEPSGDRQMARSLVAALELAGHEVQLASRLRAWSRGPEDQAAIAAAGAREAAALVEAWGGGGGGAPGLWFTYHLYYRAPDWIGPPVARALGIPYVVAEASFAMKRAGGDRAMGHDCVHAALTQAEVVLALKTGDLPGLRKVEGLAPRIVPLPPFLGVGAAPAAGARRAGVGEAPVLLAVGMMRERAKLASYRFLARALGAIADRPWVLDIVGDGPARGEVEAAFAGFPAARVHFLGVQTPDEVARLAAAADLFVWPGIDEGYGMVYLEAQAAGLPVVATESGGVSNVVIDGVSGRLVPAGDPAAYGRAIAALLDDTAGRRSLGRSAARFVRKERSLAGAAAIIGPALARVAGEGGAA